MSNEGEGDYEYTNSSSIPNQRPLLQDVLPRLRPFQREALEFATKGKIFERQWKNDSTTARPTGQGKVSSSPNGRLLLADEMVRMLNVVIPLFYQSPHFV